MEFLESLPFDRLLVFLMVLSRVSGLVVVAPLFGGSEVPAQVRALLAFTLAVLVIPTQWTSQPEQPATLVELSLVIASELFVGLALGWGVLIVFSGVQLAGAIIGQASGMTLADVFNPSFDTSIPLFSQMLHLFATAIFVLLGGHRLVMEGVLLTFQAVPAGVHGFSDSLLDTVTTLIERSFDLGIRAAAPATAALLMATLILGLISRTLPQLNVMALGFGLNSLVTLGVMALSLGAIAWVFQDELTPALAAVLEGLANR